VRAVDDPHSPAPGLKAIHYDFRLARAAEKEMGRVGADPSKIAAAAE
jgi:hydroxyquinol 1,2-dioxygenase